MRVISRLFETRNSYFKQIQRGSTLSSLPLAENRSQTQTPLLLPNNIVQI